MESTTAAGTSKGGTSDNGLQPLEIIFLVFGIITGLVIATIALLNFLYGPGVCKKESRQERKKEGGRPKTGSDPHDPGTSDQLVPRDETDTGNSPNPEPEVGQLEIPETEPEPRPSDRLGALDEPDTGNSFKQGHQQAVSSSPATMSGASSATGTRRTATIRELKNLSSALHADFYTPLAVNLDLEPSLFDNILRENPSRTDANFRMLLKWKEKTTGLVEDLDRALVESDCGALVEQYKEN